MICDTTKEEFTQSEMIDFWKKHQKKATKRDFIQNAGKLSSRDGLYFSGQNSVMVLKEGELHNSIGPAFITMYPHLQKPSGIDFYLDGKRLDNDDIVRRLVEARSKKNSEEMIWI